MLAGRLPSASSLSRQVFSPLSSTYFSGLDGISVLVMV